MIAVVVAAGVVLCSHARVLGRDRPWVDAHGTRWLLSLQVALVALAFAAPNPWVALAVAWAALHPWVTLVAFQRRWIPLIATGEDVYRYLWPTLWWTGLYVVVSVTWRPGDWRIVAYTLVLWSVVNMGFAVYRDVASSLPAWWEDHYPEARSAGAVGGSFRLAWVCAMGSLSAGMLAMEGSWDAVAWLWMAVLLAASSLWTATRMPMLAVTVALIVWVARTRYPWMVILFPGVLVAGVLSIQSSSLSARREVWRVGVRVIRWSHALGIGLGGWAALGVQREGEEKANIAWLNMHNDWLQSVVELGSPPALCAAGLLVSMWWSVPATPDALYGAIVATATAVYAVAYFPLHDHAPALLLAAALGMQ